MDSHLEGSGSAPIPGFLACSSVPLRELDGNLLPINFASGCLIDYGGRRWLLAVRHATGNMGQWAVEVEFVEGRGTKLYRVGPMSFLEAVRPSAASTEVLDLAYAEVIPDLQPYHQPRNEHFEIIHSKPCIIFHSDLKHEPSDDGIYAFAGHVEPELEPHFGQIYSATIMRVYVGLTYAGSDETFHYFRLPSDRLAETFYKGTSGAPILDADGEIAALVCGPGRESDTVRGIKMEFFCRALDVELLRRKEQAVG